MRTPPATPIPSHREGIGDGSANSVLIPEQYGPIAEWINKHIRSAHGPGFAWPMFDHIVDDSWASTGWAEGTIINQFTGTKIWSTINGATSAAADNDTIGICPGAYTEDVTIPANVTVHIITLAGVAAATSATDDWAVTLTGSTGGATATLTVTAGSGRSSISGVCFIGKTGQTAPLIDCPSSAIMGRIENCGFFGATNQTAIDLTNAVGVVDEIRDCYFDNATTGVGIDLGAGSTEGGVVQGCVFKDGTAIKGGEGVFVTGCYFNDSDLSLTTNCNDFSIHNNYFYDSQIIAAAAISAPSVSIHNNLFYEIGQMAINFGAYAIRNVSIIGNHFHNESTTHNFAYIQATGDAWGCAICDNYFVTNWRDGTTDTVETPYSGFTHWTNYCARNVMATDQYIGGGDQGGTTPYEADIDAKGNLSPGIYVGEGTVGSSVAVYWSAFDVRFGDSIVAVAAGNSTNLSTSSTYSMEVGSDGTVYFTAGAAFTAGRIPIAAVVTGTIAKMTSITRKGALLFHQMTAGGSIPAPNDAQYLVLAVDSDLTVERVFAPGVGLTVTDDGAGGDYHVAVDVGIADNKIVQIDDAAVADNDWARFTANGIEGLSDAEVLAALNLEAGTDFPSLATFEDHSARHENSGADEISVAGLSGVLADSQVANKIVETSGPTTLTVGAVADGEFLKRDGATIISAAGAAGDVATDAIWDAAGDLAVGTGANTAARLAKGTDDQVLTMVAGAVGWAAAAGGGAMATDPLWDAAGDLAVGTGANTGARLALTVPGAANLMNILGVVNGETTPVWKVLFDGTAPEPIGTAAAGTGVVAAHRNHVHAIAGANVHMITGRFYAVPESTTVPKLIVGPMPFAGTFVKLTIKSYAVAAESAIRVDLHKQTAANENTNTSTTVFTTQTNRPTIAAASYAGNTTTFEVSTFAKGDWLYFFLDVDDSGITVIDFGLEVTPS